MARYIDVEGYRKLFDAEYKETRELIYQGETHLDNLAEGFSEAGRVIDKIPTADVVPRAKIEEIFKEIEKIILDNTYPDFNREHKPVNIWKATTGYDAFYELKKKYTGSEKE